MRHVIAQMAPGVAKKVWSVGISSFFQFFLFLLFLYKCHSSKSVGVFRLETWLESLASKAIKNHKTVQLSMTRALFSSGPRAKVGFI